MQLASWNSDGLNIWVLSQTCSWEINQNRITSGSYIFSFLELPTIGNWHKCRNYEGLSLWVWEIIPEKQATHRLHFWISSLYTTESLITQYSIFWNCFLFQLCFSDTYHSLASPEKAPSVQCRPQREIFKQNNRPKWKIVDHHASLCAG